MVVYRKGILSPYSKYQNENIPHKTPKLLSYVFIMTLLTDPPNMGGHCCLQSKFWALCFHPWIVQNNNGSPKERVRYSVLSALQFALSAEGAFLLGNDHICSLTLHLLFWGSSQYWVLLCEHILLGPKVPPSAFIYINWIMSMGITSLLLTSDWL